MVRCKVHVLAPMQRVGEGISSSSAAMRTAEGTCPRAPRCAAAAAARILTTPPPRPPPDPAGCHAAGSSVTTVKKMLPAAFRQSDDKSDDHTNAALGTGSCHDSIRVHQGRAWGLQCIASASNLSALWLHAYSACKHVQPDLHPVVVIKLCPRFGDAGLVWDGEHAHPPPLHTKFVCKS
jgi:hypothetical protein